MQLSRQYLTLDDRAELLAKFRGALQINGWSQAQVRELMRRKYGKTILNDLNDEELATFVRYLSVHKPD